MAKHVLWYILFLMCLCVDCQQLVTGTNGRDSQFIIINTKKIGLSDIKKAKTCKSGVYIAIVHEATSDTVTIYNEYAQKICSYDHNNELDICALTVAKEEDIVASVSMDGSVKVFDIPQKEVIAETKEPEAVDISLDKTGSCFALICSNGMAKVFCFDEGVIQEIYRYKNQCGLGCSIFLSADARCIVSGGCYTYVCSVEDKSFMCQIETNDKSIIYGVSLSSNNRKIAIKHVSGAVGVYSLRNKKSIFTKVRDRVFTKSFMVDFSADNEFLLYTTLKEVWLTNIVADEKKCVMYVHKNAQDVSFSPDYSLVRSIGQRGWLKIAKTPKSFFDLQKNCKSKRQQKSMLLDEAERLCFLKEEMNKGEPSIVACKKVIFNKTKKVVAFNFLFG